MNRANPLSGRRRLQFAQPRQFFRQCVKFLQQLLMPDIFGVRFFRYEGKRPARLQNALTNFRKRLESLLACCSRKQRSEEHTSELQSLAYLVCRLLLEKKKKK